MRPPIEAVKRKLQPPVGRSTGVPVQGLKSGRSDERLDDLLQIRNALRRPNNWHANLLSLLLHLDHIVAAKSQLSAYMPSVKAPAQATAITAAIVRSRNSSFRPI
jgi:hypothetical protein